MNIDRIAAQRESLHKHHKSGRQLSKYSTHLVGLAGESVFARVFGLSLDTDLKPSGDGGRDFIYQGFTVDVKTTTFDGKNVYLLREVHTKHNADIYVLCIADMEARKAKLVGWEFDQIIMTHEVKIMRGQTIENYAVHREQLRPMTALKNCIWLAGYDSINRRITGE